MKQNLIRGAQYAGLSMAYFTTAYAHYKLTEAVIEKAVKPHSEHTRKHRDRLAAKKSMHPFEAESPCTT